MEPLPLFPAPLPQNRPPSGYSLEREMSVVSTTTAFDAAIDQRDTSLGVRRCIVCGIDLESVLEKCHIIPASEKEVWKDLKYRHYIPSKAKTFPKHEPRNGLTLCSIHHCFFEEYYFFIRFIPSTGKFVFVNYSGKRTLQEFHGKAIALDVKDKYVPFPSLFIIHEMRARGFNPFAALTPEVPSNSPWQDWILSEGVLDNASGSFIRDRPPANRSDVQPGLQFHSSTSTDNTASGGLKMEPLEPLNEKVIAEILAATHASASWKACEREGTSWTGTAAENIEKYTSSMPTRTASHLPDFPVNPVNP